MINAIMAVDEEGGISKNGSMPWPKNKEDLRRFKELTLNNVVIIGKLTWIDPQMPTPLKDRINVLVTSKSPSLYPGADKYISGDLKENIKKIISEYKKQRIWLIGGPNLINQLFDLIDNFFLTRIYGKFNCDKKLDVERIIKNMTLYGTSSSQDNTCRFQVWKK
tara:strand:+ start:186 stop:677 length:492 start_codon:yes stop_codon:yes gene_type:complete